MRPAATARVPMVLLAILLFFVQTCSAGDYKPEVSVTPWDKPAFKVSYFDNSPNVLAQTELEVVLSTDDGKSWAAVPELKGYTPLLMEMDPFFPDRAFVFCEGAAHFVTSDRGKTWAKYEVAAKGKPLTNWDFVTIGFNLAKPDYVILTFKECRMLSRLCTSRNFYTKDGFKSSPVGVPDDIAECVFARSKEDFDALVAPETLFCSKIKKNSFGHAIESNLVRTTDFFKKQDVVDHEYFKNGEIFDLRIESAFLVVVMKKDKFNEAEVTLVVSKDGQNFQNAELGFELKYGALIFLKSTPLSLRLSVYYQGRRAKEEVVYFSDSTGLKFEKVASVGLLSTMTSENIEGVWFADVKATEDGVEFPTRYSFDDGKTWEPLAIVGDESCKTADGCSLNFVPESGLGLNDPFHKTPDVLLTVGLKGSFFEYKNPVDTYVSRDGGASWKLAFKGPSISAYADQGNVLVAMAEPPKGEALNQLYFSLDQGNLWADFSLPVAVSSIDVVTWTDSSNTKVLFTGEKESKTYFFSVDFSGAFDGKACGKDDFEEVDARVSAEANGPTCVHGHKSTILRRKQDAKCLNKADTGLIAVNSLACECSSADFECSPYFRMSDKGACVPLMGEIAKLCQSLKNKKVKVAHQQMISGHDCTFSKSSKSDFIAESEFDCKTLGETNGGVSDEAISVKLNTFAGQFDQYSYVKSTNLSSNILVHTDKSVVHASNDGGVTFVDVPVEDDILFFVVGPVEETAVLVSMEYLYLSKDGGNTFKKVQSPGVPTISGPAVVFHPVDANKFIFIAADKLGFGSTPHYTEDGGISFKPFPITSSLCEYVANLVGSEENLIYCVSSQNGKKTLLSSTNYFESSNVLLEDVIAFAVKPNFVLVAAIKDKTALQLKVTSDGLTFADADFPSDFQVEYQSTYTILDSHPHSVFLHLTTQSTVGKELGAILKSNSNGTSYVLSLENVNRDKKGYVDYDRIETMEGVIIVNTVSNPSDSSPKKLKTQISYNDGSEWTYLMPPSIDSNKKRYSCIGSSLAKCSLNLHGFTERPDYRDTFSSSSAIGFLIGVGNVGESLTSYEEASTFISADGGVTWKEIAKGVFMWEYGDRGTILVLVDAVQATDEFLFSTDDGNTWNTHKFSEKPVFVKDLATVPSDTARKFVIFAQEAKDSSSTLAFSLDFTKFYKRQCQIDFDRPLQDDYEYWTPTHPESADNCLFGHEARYLRRAQGHYDCFIGAAPIKEGMKTIKNCKCTRRDYECDYNFFRDTDGTCKLVKGMTPQDRQKQICEKPDTFEYFESTGYRKIPLSTCVGGKTFDSWKVRACPGHESEFKKAHGQNFTFGKLLLLIILPGGIFLGVTWFVYERGIKRNGGFSRLGQIRLGDDDNNDFHPIEENNIDVVVNLVVKGGIFAVAGLVAVVKTARKIDRKLLENITKIVFRRSPGRRNYVRVPNDEDELFGDFEDNYEDELGDAAEVNFDVENEAEDFEDFTSAEPNEADARLFDIDDEDNQPHSEDQILKQ